MIDYLLVLLSVALLAGAFITQKLYQKSSDGSTESSTVFTMVSACCSIIFLIATNGFKFEFTWYSLINSILKAGCGFLYSLVGFQILKKTNVATYMLFLMSGGMAVPAVWGFIRGGEEITVLRVLGISIILIAIVLSNSSVKKLDKKLIVMCVSVFILNGFVSVLSKEHQTYTNFPIVSTSAYALMGTVCSLVMSSSLKIAISIKDKKDKKHKPKIKWYCILLIVLYSVVGTISNLLQLKGAVNLPASVLYPLITGGTIVFSGIFALIFFKEKPTVKEWIGIALCVVGTCLFL